MSEQAFSPDFLFSTLTNVHFGGGGYVVVIFFAEADAQVEIVSPLTGLQVNHVAFPLSQGGEGLGIGIAVFGTGKFEFKIRGSIDPSKFAPFVGASVYTKSPFDKAGLQWFHDYQGADQELRLQFGVPLTQVPPDPDASAGVAASGAFIVDVKGDTSTLGKGTVTLTNVSQQGG